MDIQYYESIAVIVGVIAAIIVYIINSVYQYKQRVVANAIRFADYHEKLFSCKLLSRENIIKMEKGIFKRDPEDNQMKCDFNEMLGAVETVALLAKTKIISKDLMIYMFGWFARHIQPLITTDERNNIYWEVAVNFLDEMKELADDFYKKTKGERSRYFSKNHFKH